MFESSIQLLCLIRLLCANGSALQFDGACVSLVQQLVRSKVCVGGVSVAVSFPCSKVGWGGGSLDGEGGVAGDCCAVAFCCCRFDLSLADVRYGIRWLLLQQL